MALPMQNASLHAVAGNSQRMLAIFAGALLGLVLAISGVDHATVPGMWRVAGVLVAFAGFMAILFVGARTWAATPVRHELDENGLRTFGPDGELRDRVRWSQMREYVIEPVPRTSILLLRITLTDGRVIRIAEGRTEERQAAFRVFCDRFVSAVDQQQDAAPDTSIREGAGFYEKPVMRASGTIL